MPSAWNVERRKLANMCLLGVGQWNVDVSIKLIVLLTLYQKRRRRRKRKEDSNENFGMP